MNITFIIFGILLTLYFIVEVRIRCLQNQYKKKFGESAPGDNREYYKERRRERRANEKGFDSQIQSQNDWHNRF